MHHKTPRKHYVALNTRVRRIKQIASDQSPLRVALGGAGVLVMAAATGLATKAIGMRRLRRIFMCVSFGRRLWQHCYSTEAPVNNLNDNKAVSSQNNHAH